MDERVVKLINRLGFAATASAGTILHLYEKMADPNLRQSFPITEHVGDISFGWNAVLIGKLLSIALRRTGVIEPRHARAVSLAATGVIFGLVILNETIGLGGGTPDLKDIPGAAIGVLGAASLIELGSQG